MGELMSAHFLLELGKLFGVPVLLFALMLWGFREKQERDRGEHMRKWESMMDTHKQTIELIVKQNREAIDRMFILHERTAVALEAQTHEISVLGQKIDTNQFCPMVRREQGGK